MNIYDINEFGAIGDGKTDSTKMIQKAIDECSSKGGGTVLIRQGTYRIGTIYFKSNVILDVQLNAELLALTDKENYPDDTLYQMYHDEKHMDRCLFYAEGCENIGIQGRGKINGNGSEFSEFRPMMFRYYKCRNICIKDIRLISPASWTNAFIGCEDIWIDGIDIKSRTNANGDGLDFDGCKNIFISNCKFDCSDDCICLQNSFVDKKCNNVVVNNCIMSSKWAGMRIGLLSCGPIEDVTVSNCIFQDIECSALKIQSSEGSTIKNMTFTNLVMTHVQRALFLTANRHRERINMDKNIVTSSYVGSIRITNVILDNISYEMNTFNLKSPTCMIIDADDNNIIEDIFISDVYLKKWGDSISPYSSFRNIPGHYEKRAEAHNYNGTLPSKGLFARNVKNLNVTNLQVKDKIDNGHELILKI